MKLNIFRTNTHWGINTLDIFFALDYHYYVVTIHTSFIPIIFRNGKFEYQSIYLKNQRFHDQKAHLISNLRDSFQNL